MILKVNFAVTLSFVYRSLVYCWYLKPKYLFLKIKAKTYSVFKVTLNMAYNGQINLAHHFPMVINTKFLG